MKISKSELMHLRIQAAMRENDFGDEIQYLGFDQDKDEYMYLIAGEHKVGASQIDGFDRVED
jgi:hypothetical protein